MKLFHFLHLHKNKIQFRYYITFFIQYLVFFDSNDLQNRAKNNILFHMIKADITDLELKKHLDSLEEDKLSIFTLAEGRVRGQYFSL